MLSEELFKCYSGKSNMCRAAAAVGMELDDFKCCFDDYVSHWPIDDSIWQSECKSREELGLEH